MNKVYLQFRNVKLLVLIIPFIFCSFDLYAQYSIFTDQAPVTSGTDGPYELGTKFTTSRLAEITAIRFYKMPGETGSHTGSVWTSGGEKLAFAAFTSETASGWQRAELSSPLRIDAGAEYVVSVNVNTVYSMTQEGFSSAITNGFLSAVGGNNGVFNNTQGSFPSNSYKSSNYFVDIVASPLDEVFTTQLPEETFPYEGPLELGLKFTVSEAAKVRFIRYYKAAAETGNHTGNLWDAGGNNLASVSFTNETTEGWQYAELNTDIYLNAGSTYVVSVNSNTVYAATKNALGSPVTNGILTAPGGNNGVFSATVGSFPSSVFDSPNYFRDILVIPIYTPSAPVNPSPADEMTGVSIEPTLHWSAIVGGTSYTLEIADDAGFTSNVRTIAGITSNSYALTGLLNSKSYYWRVKGVNSFLEGSFSAVFKFTTIAHTDIILSYPTGGVKLYVENPILTWYIPQGGTGWKYDLMYSTDINMTSSVTVYDLTGTDYILEGLQAGTTYYWKVRLKTSAGAVVGYSAKESFITVGEALKPVASWPLGGTTVYALTQELYWFLNGAGTGLTYEVEIREGGLTVLTNTATNADINETHFNATGLLPDKQYSWQVRSKSASGGYSLWSDPVSFKTAAKAGTIVPVASWPTGDAVVYTLSPSLNWYLMASSEGLTFDVEIVEGFETSFTETPTIEGINSLFVDAGTLNPGSDYKWRVRSYNGTDYSKWSEPASFSISGTIGNAPVVPILTWPVQGALVYSSKTDLRWYAITASTGLQYEIEYGQGALSGTPIITGITDLWKEITGLETGKTYNWRVRSTSELGNSDWSETETFTAVDCAPVAVTPILSWPAEGVTVYTNSPMLTWFLNSPSAGLTYELSYSTSSSMTGATLFSGLEATAYQLENLSPGATYYWQVRSYDGTVYSAPSEIRSFVVFAGNAAVVPIAGSPVNGVQTGTISPVLSWFIPTQGEVKSYMVEYSKKPDMSEPLSLEVSKNSVTLDKLSSESSYYWRVCSMNSKGEKSRFSEVETFSTASATGVEKGRNIPSEFVLKQNYPNPFNPATMIEVSLAKDGFYKLEAYNILGEKAASIMQGNMKAGSYKFSFNAKNLVSGIYFYKLSGNGVSMVKKMLLVK